MMHVLADGNHHEFTVLAAAGSRSPDAGAMAHFALACRSGGCTIGPFLFLS